MTAVFIYDKTLTALRIYYVINFKMFASILTFIGFYEFR